MKKIEAVIRPEKLDALRRALQQAGYPGMTILDAEGHGSQKGSTQEWAGEEYRLEFLPKSKIEIICKNAEAEKLIQIIVDNSVTGNFGDGKIFIYDVADVVRIRTQERGDKALV